jgi:hypothetical protein
MTFTLHARARFAERFPACPISLESAFLESVPYGAETKSTIYRIHMHHRIVFVVDKSDTHKYVRTVLTEDLYIANLQMLVGQRAFGVQLGAAPAPTPAAARTRVDRAKIRCENARVQVEKQKRDKREADVAIDRYLREQGRAFAKEKSYGPWLYQYYNEAIERFGVSKRMIRESFVPGYVAECNEHALFNS